MINGGVRRVVTILITMLCASTKIYEVSNVIKMSGKNMLRNLVNQKKALTYCVQLQHHCKPLIAITLKHFVEMGIMKTPASLIIYKGAMESVDFNPSRYSPKTGRMMAEICSIVVRLLFVGSAVEYVCVKNVGFPQRCTLDYQPNTVSLSVN